MWGSGYIIDEGMGWKVIKDEPDEKRIKVGPWVVVLTNKDYEFTDEEDGEEVWLSDETGWWTNEGEIFVYLPAYRTRRERVGVTVHEWLERLLVRRLGMGRAWAHMVANIAEKVVSLGKARLYWR
ncbi:MAG: hypothetical protein JHC26_08465 [Thermofilum sp.]|uniref:hypothetical protein n=1 Tax=Thermofilum sp. TaxID=1961369 RepID=UPI0025864BE8|nr:hypothetical protein [Thermofilum sp.]MCI4409109.1 hypothetical protein [Thermofilum sp.]